MFSESLHQKFGSVAEVHAHPHVPEERAEAFSAVDCASTELETLNLLNALVYSFKPRRVLETGTFRGFGTVAIVAALEANGNGEVISLESVEALAREARGNIERYNPALCARVRIHVADSVTWLRTHAGEPFDFIFLDSDLSTRLAELEALEERGLLASEALVLIHDTSRHRPRYLSDVDTAFFRVLEERTAAWQSLCSDLSRGFTLLKRRPDPPPEVPH